jgi:CRP/FNR family transcriptional regulator, cyclic AMP receptor protein
VQQKSGLARTRRGALRRDEVAVVDAVPELFDALAPDRMAPARRHLRASVLRLRRGRWDAQADAEYVESGLGFLIIEGAVLRCVGLAHRAGGELLGPGDLIRPDRDLEEAEPFALTWRCLTDATLAILDDRFTEATLHFPEISTALSAGAARRTNSMSRQLVIAQFPSMDDRILHMLRVLSERWGVMTRDGVLLPGTFSHSTLALLLGARRPSVTTSTARLEAAGKVMRRDDGRWLLAAEALA